MEPLGTAPAAPAARRRDRGRRRFVVALPEPSLTLDQDEEWCVVRIGDDWREIRFHDYADVYEVEGLYEHIFAKTLGCQSPEFVVGLLRRRVEADGGDPASLRVLDLGAGNGMVGDQCRAIGASTVVGVDIVEQAAAAARRDRPEVYDDYLVADMTALTESEAASLRSRRFNALTCVAALGFGDIPSEAFRVAFNLVEDGGWVAFNIRDRFLDRRERSGFSDLIHSLIERGILADVVTERYVHRISTNRTPLEYVALAGRKQGDA